MLPFDKKLQAKKGKKKVPAGPTRKEERRQEKADQWENHDRAVYEQVLERSYSPIHGTHMCEWCGKRRAEQMHHLRAGTARKTTLENVRYICSTCHNDHHAGRIRITNGNSAWPTGDSL